MAILVLGAAGTQGRAALYDLSKSEQISEIIAADSNVDNLESLLSDLPGDKVRAVKTDATDTKGITELMREAGELVVDALPMRFTSSIATMAIENGVSLVSMNYIIDPSELDTSRRLTQDDLARLDSTARRKGVTILPEFGLDPGIDLVFCGQAVRELDEVHELYSYGAGFPEAEAANNPLKYKVSWLFRNVLRSYYREARIVCDGRVVDIPAKEIFAPAHTHILNIPELGEFDAFANGDITQYVQRLGIEETIRTMGRFVLRWPGHNKLWKTFVDLNFLEDTPIEVGTCSIAPRDFLERLLEPQLQYAPKERDVAIVRVDVRGIKNGKRKRVLYQLIDKRDLSTGFTAMQRTTGFTASIGAQMILRGDISDPGILSPTQHVPFDTFVSELGKRGMDLKVNELDW